MAFNIEPTLKAVESFLAASGYVRKTWIGEPKAPPDKELSAAVYMASVAIAELTLGTTIEVHTVNIRIYRNMLAAPVASGELEVARAVQKIVSDLLGDFDLGSTIRNVDAGGQYGQSVRTDWGHIEVSKTMFRVADIVLPLIVDDSATLTA